MKSRLALVALVPTLAAVAFFGPDSAAAGDGGIYTVTTTQARCYHHHVQKRTVTAYIEDGSNGIAGTMAAANTYGSWVTKKRPC